MVEILYNSVILWYFLSLHLLKRQSTLLKSFLEILDFGSLSWKQETYRDWLKWREKKKKKKTWRRINQTLIFMSYPESSIFVPPIQTLKNSKGFYMICWPEGRLVLLSQFPFPRNKMCLSLLLKFENLKFPEWFPKLYPGALLFNVRR